VNPVSALERITDAPDTVPPERSVIEPRNEDCACPQAPIAETNNAATMRTKDPTHPVFIVRLLINQILLFGTTDSYERSPTAIKVNVLLTGSPFCTTSRNPEIEGADLPPAEFLPAYRYTWRLTVLEPPLLQSKSM
jgi:hypothetical protein